MAQLRRDQGEFESRDTRIIVIGPDSKDDFAAFWSQHGLTFTGLPDPNSRVAAKFGQEIKLFKFGRMPAQVIVDRDGVVRFAHYGSSMSDIPANQELLAVIDILDAEVQAAGE